MEDQFWPDAQVDYGQIYHGPVAGFVEVAMQFQASMRDTQHFIGNVLIDIEGSAATAESYVHAQHVIADGPNLMQLVVGGRYLDRLECRAGRWRLAFRTEVIDWGRRVPIPERWFESNQELTKGERSFTDLSYRFLNPTKDDR